METRYMLVPKERKRQLIRVWKVRGVKCNDYDSLYEEYQNQSYCQVCGCDFKKKWDKCLDHEHSTGEVRFILCRLCNIHDNWMKYFL